MSSFTHNVEMNPFGFFKKRVTPDDIVWCYRHLLGREPEGEEAITPHLTHKSFRELADVFAKSDEGVRYREASALVIHNRRPSTYLAPALRESITKPPESTHKPMGKIDSVANVDQLTLCAQRVLPAWERCATQKNAPQAGVADLLASYMRHGARAGCPGVFVELCCGAGRAALELAATVEQIHAYDMSPALLATGRGFAAPLGQRSLEFCDLTVAPLDKIQPCQYLYSVASLQHFPPPIAATYLRKGLSALAPNGLAIVQLLTQIDGYAFNLVSWLKNEPDDVLQLHALPLERILEIIAGQGCELVAVEEDGSVPHAASIQSSRIVIRKLA